MVENFLFNYLAGFNNITTKMGTIAYATDIEHKIIAVSDAFLVEFQVTRAKTLHRKLGIGSSPILQWYRKNSKVISQQNATILECKHAQTFMDIIDVDRYSQLYIVRKYPIISGDKAVAIYTVMQRFSLPRLEDIFYCCFDFKHYVRPILCPYQLTNRQAMVLFLVMRNYSYSEVAVWMNAFGIKISAGRVNEHLTALRGIFDVTTTQQLMNQAIKLGYHANMPAGFLKNGSYQIDQFMSKLNVFNDYPLTSSALFNQKYSKVNSVNNCAVVLQLDSQLKAFIADFQVFYAASDEMAYLFSVNGQLIAGSKDFMMDFDDFGINNLANHLKSEIGIMKLKDVARVTLDVIENRVNHVSIYITNKYLLYNNLGEIIGVLGQMRSFVIPRIHEMMVKIFGVFNLPALSINPQFKLTPKQHLVLFFYARNYSSTQIADILTAAGYTMAVDTVNKHLKKIKVELGINSKDKLIDAALCIGYNLIPLQLIKVGAFDLDGMVVQQWVC